MMSPYESLEKTIRESGFLAIKALLVLNAFGLFTVWANMLHPRATELGLQAAWPLFLLGIVFTFGTILVTYIAAQMAINDKEIGLSISVILIVLPAIALIMFCQGVINVFSATGGA